MKKILVTFTAMSFMSCVYAETSYMMVVNAGSSSSKLYVYSYEQTSPNSLPTNIKTVLKNTASPGLQNISTTDIPKYMTTLFNGTAKTLAAPLYFYATASMRVISPTVQSADYQAISQWISQNTSAELKDIATLSGEKEALYDWVADNQLQNGFQDTQNLHGILDMGGGSFEIAYPTDASDPQATLFNVNNQKLYVHTQSYLGLGQDYSRYQYTDEVACFPLNYPMPDANTAAGSALGCEASIVPFLAIAKVHPQFLPANISFDALSGFYYTAQTVMQGAGNFNLNLNNYQQATATFCASDWNQLLSDPKFAGVKDYLYSYCYAASEQIALLHMLGFSVDKNNITAVDKINGNSVDWSLGTLVAKATNPS